MKKYRLKKDTPTIKAGTIFQEVTSDYDKSRELVRIMPLSGTTSPQWTIDDINNFDEWFEEVREFEEWKPKEGEEYKWLSITGTIVRHARAVTDTIYNYNASIGNCYPLDTPDELIIKEQKLIPQAMHRLKMAAKKAWFEFDGSEGPDWSDIEQGKYYIYFNYSYMTRTYSVVEASLAQTLGCVYFPTKESCQAHIDNNPEDLKLLFGVE